MIVLKTEREVSYMRDAGKIVGQTFLELKKAIAPGITTHELDHIADQYIRRAGAIPAFKGYAGFRLISVLRLISKWFMGSLVPVS